MSEVDEKLLPNIRRKVLSVDDKDYMGSLLTSADCHVLLRLLDERTKERDEARAALGEFAKRVSHGWEELKRWYGGADEERRIKGTCGSQHRDGFEAWLDSLVCDASDMLKERKTT